MGKPAARLLDMHLCPMVTGIVPHVGGPITGPGSPTVLIGGLPAVTMGDMCTCVGPPDTIILGSAGVFINGKPAARMGDACSHGGTILLGCMTVLIGETISPDGGGGADASAIAVQLAANTISNMDPSSAVKATHVAAIKEAATYGAPLVHNPKTCPICSKKL